MSPIIWDLGHIATFEDLWLVQRAAGRPALRADLGSVYDPFQAPRSERGELPYLRSEDCFAYMGAVRERTLECLEQADLSEDAEPLTAGGFVYEMVLRHEMQHTETMLQTLQIMTTETYSPPRAHATPPAPGDAPVDPAALVAVPAGPFEMGAGPTGFAYDNERPRHIRDTGPFLIEALPVTNARMAEFVVNGGYARRELWSAAGWDWLQRDGAQAPMYWTRNGDGFAERHFAEMVPLDPRRPACHVSWFEADAFARWCGRRLPTEAEWEKAASWDGVAGAKRAFPWGDAAPERTHANLDQLAFETAPAGCLPLGSAPCGAQQMAGDVWEWTASGFDGYPGFRAFPYREYSEEFFGGPYRVLRGGSWATPAGAVTNTFRNWDHPDRRQIFAGFRCAADPPE